MLKSYREANMVLMWLAIIVAYILFFFGFPYHMWAVGFALCNISSVLILSAFIEEDAETKNPTHSQEVKWDPKKKNDDIKKK